MTDAIRQLQSRRVGGLEIRLLLEYIHELGRTISIAAHELTIVRRRVGVWAQANEKARATGDLPPLDDTQMCAAIEGFLAAYARASLLLFPSRQGYARRRGGALREFLSIADDHRIADRRLRNDWLHYDERLDQLIQTSDRGRWGFIILDGSTHAADAFHREFVRMIDPRTLDVFFLGERYSLCDLMARLDDVRERIQPALDKHLGAADA